MSRRLPALSLLWMLPLVALLPVAAQAMGPNLVYHETFATTRYEDVGATTADWDTVRGCLSMARFTPTVLGSYGGAGTTRGIAVAGGVACVASSSSGLVILSTGNPASPTLLGQIAVSGKPVAIAVEGTTAYVAAGTGGLSVFDISHPTAPALRGRYETDYNTVGLAVVGHYAFLAELTGGLTIVNVADPRDPTYVSRVATRDRAIGVAVSGDYAFVADYLAGLCVIDISDVADPIRRTNVETGAYAQGVAVSGNVVGLVSTDGDLFTFDVTTPTAPEQLGSLTLPGSATSVAFHGDLAYVTSMAAALYAVDLSDPATPRLKWTCPLGQAGRGVAVAGDVGWVADDAFGIKAVRVSELMAPYPKSPMQLGIGGTVTQSSRGMAVSRDVLCVVGEPDGLVTLSMADPYNVQFLGSVSTPGNALAVAASGDLVCIADSLAGLRTYSIADPGAPTSLGGYDTPGQALDVALWGDVACVADGTGGLRLVNVANPSTPSLLGACSLPGTANAVSVSGRIACVTDGALRLVDIASPSSPTLVGSYTGLDGKARGVAVSGSVAWVTADTLGLYAFDIHDPAAPALLGRYQFRYHGWKHQSPHMFGNDILLLLRADCTNIRMAIVDGANPAVPGELLADGPAALICGNSLVTYGDIAICSWSAGGMVAGGVRLYQLAQNDVSGPLSASAQSLPVTGNPRPYVVRVRPTMQYSGQLTFSITGNQYQGDVWPDGSHWYTMDGDTTLVWDAYLRWHRDIPTVTDVRLDWRLREARVDSIVDIPGDQGGWVNMYFTCSGYDSPFWLAAKVFGYTVYRKVETVLLAGRVREAFSLQASSAKAAGATPDPACSVDVDGVTYVVNDGAQKASPAGVWSVVSSFFADFQDQYVVTLPTTADDGPDGPAYAKFFVRAQATAEEGWRVWYDSAPDSGRSVDNLAPATPTGFAVAYYGAGGNLLTWDASSARDFQYFRVYRGTDPDFVPSAGTLVRTTTATSWSDPDYHASGVYYKVTALDFAGNESDPASPDVVSGVADETPPQAFALRANVPNPFNPATTIYYDVPEGGGSLRLAVYDARGRLVRALVEGARPAGRCAVVWNGRDDHGRALPTGVYFGRLTAPGYTHSVKMSLVQ